MLRAACFCTSLKDVDVHEPMSSLPPVDSDEAPLYSFDRSQFLQGWILWNIMGHDLVGHCAQVSIGQSKFEMQLRAGL